jgi:hypothetical protein
MRTTPRLLLHGQCTTFHHKDISPILLLDTLVVVLYLQTSSFMASHATISSYNKFLVVLDKSSLIIRETYFFILAVHNHSYLKIKSYFSSYFLSYLPLDWSLLTMDKWRSLASKHIQLPFPLHRSLSTICISLDCFTSIYEFLYYMLVFITNLRHYMTNSYKSVAVNNYT